MKVSGFLWVVIAFFSFSYHLPTFAETSIELQTKERVHSKILPNRLTGFAVSPDGLRVAYVVGAGQYSEKYQRDEDAEGWQSNKLVVDGKLGHSYYSIDIDEVFFSPNSQHFAYLMGTGNYSQQILVVDKKQVGECRYAQAAKFTDDSKSCICVATGPNGHILDTKKNEGYTGNGYPTFSPDHKRLAVAISIRDENLAISEAYMVIDGKEGKKYHQVGEHIKQGIVFSPDSKNIAYMAAINSGKEDSSGFRIQEWRVVLNDKEDKPYRYVSNITFSPNSTKLAYVAHNAIDGKTKAKSFIVQNGVAGKAYDEIADLVFSPDSKTLAYVAHKNKKMFVVVNGKEDKSYDYVLAKNTYEANYSDVLETGSLHFDSNQKLKYLAVRNKQILLVETSFK